jgi:hypothetical protein
VIAGIEEKHDADVHEIAAALAFLAQKDRPLQMPDTGRPDIAQLASGKPEARPAAPASRENRGEILERRRDYAEGRLARYRIDVGREHMASPQGHRRRHRQRGRHRKPLHRPDQSLRELQHRRAARRSAQRDHPDPASGRVRQQRSTSVWPAPKKPPRTRPPVAAAAQEAFRKEGGFDRPGVISNPQAPGPTPGRPEKRRERFDSAPGSANARVR